jgi:hypothetical protein
MRGQELPSSSLSRKLSLIRTAASATINRLRKMKAVLTPLSNKMNTKMILRVSPSPK